ncbi:MAG: phospholipid/cholesterol/gamma-HCH transport system substrate-binding protein [Candidatus Cloacimonadota bacterium]|nr:phospholipid/cholesterol/gamma-HCH transport system substrate-binding protein [Candidatus Cloacimonadota bacterium]
MKFYENKTNLEIKVGIFTLLALVILILGYMWFMQLLEHKKYTTLQVEFENIGKIEKGSTVSVRGLRRGKVDKIQLTPDGVVTDLLVDLPLPLPADSKFYIKEMDAMGSVRVDIIPGTSEKKMDYNQVQIGQKSFGISNLVVKLNNLTEKIQDFANKLESDKQMLPQVKNILNSTENFVKNLDNSYQKNEDKLDIAISGLANLVEDLNSFLETNRDKLDSGIATADTTMHNLNNAVQEFNQLASNLNKILQPTQAGQGSIGKMIAEEELYDNLLKISARLDSLLKDIKENPGRYFKVKVF